MRKLNILIVEDEILIAELIGDYLKEKGYSVLGIAISYEEALKEYNLRKPDLILLDIKLYGEKSGIDLASYFAHIKANIPIIYLSSQYDKNTLELALKTNPYGYLTKPIRKESLWTSIEAAYKIHESNKQKNVPINIVDGKNQYFITNNEILYLEADHVYVVIHLVNGKTLTIRHSLKQIYELLDKKIMIQCHRGYIINRNHIQYKNSECVIMINGKKLPLSRSKKKYLTDILKPV